MRIAKSTKKKKKNRLNAKMIRCMSVCRVNKNVIKGVESGPGSSLDRINILVSKKFQTKYYYYNIILYNLNDHTGFFVVFRYAD